MKVVILCGGLGTRLREETEFRPKPMVEVGGRPILWHIMKIYAHYGLSRFRALPGLSRHDDQGIFPQLCGDEQRLHLALNCQRTDPVPRRTRGTGLPRHAGRHRAEFHDRRPREPRREIHRRRHLHGDLWRRRGGHRPRPSCCEFHRRHGKLATVTTVRARVALRRGRSRRRRAGRATSPRSPRGEGWISAGYFVFERGSVRLSRATTHACILEREPLERLAADGQLMAYRHDGFFYAMDTYREYEAL